MRRFVVYYRVSTKRQGDSGLGLEAQEAAYERYRSQIGGRTIGTYREIESGKRNDRPELQKAIAHARRSKATLVVAKLDRLSRNAGFLMTLQESGLPIVCCDMPDADEMTIGVMALVARKERQDISNRTRDALAAAKARGVLLGSARPGHWDGKEDRRLAGAKKAAAAAAKAHTRHAAEAYGDLLPLIHAMRDKGESLQAIADRLNADGHTTRNGKPWNRMQVGRVLQLDAPAKPKPTTPQTDPAATIEGMARRLLEADPRQGGLLSIPLLRAAVGLPAAEFDAALTRLAKDGRIALYPHDHPAGLSDAERVTHLADGNRVFNALSLR